MNGDGWKEQDNVLEARGETPSENRDSVERSYSCPSGIVARKARGRTCRHIAGAIAAILRAPVHASDARSARARSGGRPISGRPHINRGRDFFITVRADCIFLRLPTTGMSNLENRVEGGPSNHVFPAIGVLRRSSSRHPFIYHHPPFPSPPPARIFILGHNPLLGRTRSPLFDGRRDDRDTGSLPSLPPPCLSLSLSSSDLFSSFPFLLSSFLFSLFFFFTSHRPPFHQPGTPLQSGLAVRRN